MNARVSEISESSSENGLNRCILLIFIDFLCAYHVKIREKTEKKARGMSDNEKEMPEFGEELTVKFENVRAEYVNVFERIKGLYGLDESEAFEHVVKECAEKMFGVENAQRMFDEMEDRGIPDLSM